MIEEIVLMFLWMLSVVLFILVTIVFAYILFRAAGLGWYRSKWDYLKKTFNIKGEDSGKR